MSIEKSLERIADALEALTQNVPTASGAESIPAKKTTTKKKAAKKTDEPAAPAGEATEDGLRQCFQEYVGKKGNEEGTAKLKELIGGYGAGKIGEVKPKDYAAIIKEVKSWN